MLKLQLRLRRFLTYCSFCGLFLLWIGCNIRTSNPTPTIHELRIAAAANLKPMLGEIIPVFNKQYPEIKLTPTFGSSGNFFAQIVNRAPFDLFLSADVDYPTKIVEQGLASKENQFSYAVGKLVVWVPKESTLDLDRQGLRVLADPKVKKLALANPRLAPYGRAGEAALKKSGVYESVQTRLVIGENVEQTAHFVQSGAADAGLIPLSLALSPTMKEKGRYWLVPQDDYPLLTQAGVILTEAKEKEAAGKLRAFLLSDAGKKLLQKHGYDLPKE